MTPVAQWVRETEAEITRLRRAFHRIPELGFREEKTAALVAETLCGLGLSPRTVAGTGVVADLDGFSPGPRILLRADMDGLPIREETGADYASEHEGVMHACGHDGHMAILCAAAKYLSENRSDLHGAVRFMFQPGEEGYAGAKAMLAEGTAEGCSAAIALHLWGSLPVGRAVVRAGSFMASMDRFTVSVHGESSHGAMPHEGVDAIVVTGAVLSALQSIVSRELPPQAPAVLSIGTIHGGRAYNVLADEVSAEGTVRVLDTALRESMPARIERIAQGVAQGMRARAVVRYDFGYPVLRNDPTVCARVCEAAQAVLGKSEVSDGEPVLVSEDFAFVCEEIPGCLFLLGAGNPRSGFSSTHHHPRFGINETALAHGVEILIRAVLSCVEARGS
jgi:amidohydrolase